MRETFERLLPGRFFLDARDVHGIEAWLGERGHLLSEEDVGGVSRAGDGNMNLTLRVQTDKRSFILKQARPWVEKYPSIAAPVERISVENAFYAATKEMAEVVWRSPGVLFFEEADGILALQDLGTGADFTDIYGPSRMRDTELSALAAYLTDLHSRSMPSRPVLRNRAMRALNHEHIFALPLRPENGLDLDGYCEGLAEAAAPLLQDEAYRQAVTALGERYLADGARLVHGDFYPGSFLRAGAEVRVIDAEFAHLGAPEFDVGVFIAHLILSGEAPQSAASRVLDRYQLCSGFKTPLALNFAGVEVMRRLLGVAQLPLRANVELRANWLSISKTLVLQSHA